MAPYEQAFLHNSQSQHSSGMTVTVRLAAREHRPSRAPYGQNHRQYGRPTKMPSNSTPPLSPHSQAGPVNWKALAQSPASTARASIRRKTFMNGSNSQMMKLGFTRRSSSQSWTPPAAKYTAAARYTHRT